MTSADNPNASSSSTVCLAQLEVGERARVVGYRDPQDDYAKRLQSLGLTAGTELVLQRYAPLGDPAEIFFRGTRLAIRPAEAEGLLLEHL